MSLASRMVCLTWKSRVHVSISSSSGTRFPPHGLSLPVVEISSVIFVLPGPLVEAKPRNPFGEEVARNWPDVRRAKVVPTVQSCCPEDDRAHDLAVPTALQT